VRYPLEKTTQTKILAFLKTLRPEGFFFKIHQALRSMAGISDILGCYKGRFCAFEVKSDSGTASRKQEWFLRMVAAAGGTVGVVRSIADVKTLLSNQ